MNAPQCRIVFSLFLSLLALDPAIAGQSESALMITVLQGSDAETVVMRPASKPLTLRVTDSSNRPVAGATVVLTSPRGGPGGVFVNGSNSMIVFTNQQGIAVAQDYRANSNAGAYQIQVQAAYMAEVARISINHTNVVPSRLPSKKILIAAAAGGALAVALATMKGEPAQQPNSHPGGPDQPTIVLLGSSVRGSR
jgi:hypothetical protein